MGLGLGMGMGEAAVAKAMAAVAPRLALEPRNSIECSEEKIRDDGNESSDDDRTETVQSEEAEVEVEEEDLEEDSGSEFVVKTSRSRRTNMAEEESKDEKIQAVD